MATSTQTSNILTDSSKIFTSKHSIRFTHIQSIKAHEATKPNQDYDESTKQQ